MESDVFSDKIFLKLVEDKGNSKQYARYSSNKDSESRPEAPRAFNLDLGARIISKDIVDRSLTQCVFIKLEERTFRSALILTIVFADKASIIKADKECNEQGCRNRSNQSIFLDQGQNNFLECLHCDEAIKNYFLILEILIKLIV